MPSDTDAAALADLVADARAIPAAAFSVSRCAARRVIDLTVTPVQRAIVIVPDATMSLVEAAEEQFAGFRR